MKGIQTTHPRREVAVKGSKVARRLKQEEEKKLCFDSGFEKVSFKRHCYACFPISE